MTDLLSTARDLVSRARNGDQNAMAIISLVGKKAREEKPNKLKAKLGYEAIRQAMEEDKIGGEEISPMTDDLKGLSSAVSFYDCLGKVLSCCKGFIAAVVVLANGPQLTVERCSELTELADQPRKEVAAMQVLHQACALQAVRAGGPMYLMGNDVAWELG